MPRVKIQLHANETPEEADEALFKALSSHRTGEIHTRENFIDPAMQDQAEIMNQLYERLFQRMLQEIGDVIEEAKV